VLAFKVCRCLYQGLLSAGSLKGLMLFLLIPSQGLKLQDYSMDQTNEWLIYSYNNTDFYDYLNHCQQLGLCISFLVFSTLRQE